MAEGIQLSRELIDKLIGVIGQHDADAREDMLVNLQYLCAVAGYLAADYPGPASERDELLEHLHAFMKHVCDDRANQEAAPPAHTAAPSASAQGQSMATDDPAVGIWKPE
ncbi:MAG: hypothetical protein GC149_11080 [Gammaproteobacteria bacterium]|nr:hypothetical protein [Gammaproteobacteria bacterium]